MGRARAETKYSEALEVALAPSRLALAALLGAAMLTLAVLAATPLPQPPRILLACGVVFATAESILRVALLRGPFAVRALRIDRQGAIALQDVRGRWSKSGVLRPGAFVAPWLAVVRWRPAGGWVDRTVLVLPDMLADEPFRRLRVWLRMS